MPSQSKGKIITKKLTIERPLDVTFKLFTEEMGEWWPDNYSVAGTGSTTVIEPRRGGRIFQRSRTGQEFELGKVRTITPPNHLVFTWRQPDWDGATEVDVRFTSDGETTRIDLEHRGWEKVGKWGDDFRKDYDVGWDDILPRLVTHAQGGDKKRSARDTGSEVQLKPARLSPAVKQVLADPPADGLLVHSVRGEGAGTPEVKEADVIVSFAGQSTPEWDDYYRIHCSVTNTEVVPLVVVRDGRKVTIKTSRTWIASAQAPFWPVKKGTRVDLRPKATKVSFDLSVVKDGPIETWYRNNDARGKKIGYECHVWWVEGHEVRFLHEGAQDRMGLQHSMIDARISYSETPQPLSSMARDLSTGMSVDASAIAVDGKMYWRALTEGRDRRSSRVALPKDAMLAIPAHCLCAFMSRREGATWAWTPVDEYSGGIGLPLATVCIGRKELKLGRQKLSAWKFEVIQLGRTLTSMWVYEDGRLIRVESRFGSLTAVDRTEALKGVPTKLRPHMEVSARTSPSL